MIGAFALALALQAPAELDERPAAPGEWGFRPAAEAVVARTPPSFAWRPQEGARTYELEVAPGDSFEGPTLRAEGLHRNVHCPSTILAPGDYRWRFRALLEDGRATRWSEARAFTVPEDAVPFALPPRDVLEARVPREHPRLFLRPEQLGELRRRLDGELAEPWAALRARCDALLAAPPDTTEPPKYPPGTERGSDAWRAIWWGNRKRTIAVLEAAATLGFVQRLGGGDAYAELGVRLLMEAAAWDPKGATGYRYNDEAGMPYAYHFSRAYTFLHDRLDEQQRATCRSVMRTRGREMHAHLDPRHLWKPYSSHSNSAWHFLGEVGIAFYDEIPEAADWLDFAVQVFANVYPVWSDADGGWHEGAAYWRSYLSRFTWWADVMREAIGLDAYRLPFFGRVGDFALYVMPPGTRGGGFGDLCGGRTSEDNVELMTVFAAQAGDPHWQWYVEQHGGPRFGAGYVGLLRSSLPRVEARAPDALPRSRWFRGTGLVALNASLAGAGDNVELLLKASPFGSQSHGYEAQGAFLLYAFGERLLIRSGRRDSYGSRHHREWMWETKSVNAITVDGRGKRPHSAAARGEVVHFESSERIDLVVARAELAYPGTLERFERRVLFVPPDLIVVEDLLRAPAPARFDWHLHAPTAFEPLGDRILRIENGAAACELHFLAPAALELEQTDRFDLPPRPRVKLVEHHLTATPAARSREQRFVTLLRPHPAEKPAPRTEVQRGKDGLRIEARVGDARATVTWDAEGALAVELVDAASGAPIEGRVGPPRDRFEPPGPR